MKLSTADKTFLVLLLIILLLRLNVIVGDDVHLPSVTMSSSFAVAHIPSIAPTSLLLFSVFPRTCHYLTIKSPI